MLTRYQMARGVPASKLPKGLRMDTRKHTQSVLRPTATMVEDYLSAPSDAAWKKLAKEYRALLNERFRKDRAPFDAIAERAMDEDVYLGCSCPTQKNPSVRHCHTWLALEFFHQHYPKLDVVMPRE